MSRSFEHNNAGFQPSACRGEGLELRYRNASQALWKLPHHRARSLPIIKGLKSSGKFCFGQENVLINIGETLLNSSRFYRYGTDYLYVVGEKVLTIADATGVKPAAPGILANVMVFEEKSRSGEKVDFLLSTSVISATLHSHIVTELLPEIKYLTKTPVFSSDFILLQGPKFHQGCGTMVLSQPVEPVSYTLSQESNAVDRLPRLLHRLLRRFCFRSNADVANALAVLITAVLMNHCIGFARALIIVDGNRPNVGKTLLLQSLGVVVDGKVAEGIPYVANDEELQKRIIARIQRSRSRLLFVDNAKKATGTHVSSPVLESIVSDQIITGRILTTSNEVAVPNDFIFGITMNCTNVSPDLLSRALPIQLHYEDGDPRCRDFENEDPLQFASENRDGIIAELLGMVDHWIGQGCPSVSVPHRCHKWASLIGSVLHACGFPEFLMNFGTAAKEFDSQTEELCNLFDSVCASHPPQITLPGTAVRIPAEPLPSGKWGDYLRDIPSHTDTFSRAKGNGVGMQAQRVLGVYVNCPFVFVNNHGTGTAVLRSESMRGRQTGYYFEATFTGSEPDNPAPLKISVEDIPL